MTNNKTILMLRHGKSDWGASYSSDHERPLAPRGERAARRIGSWLSRIDRAPDLVLTSDAVRARTTVELAAQAGGWECPIELRPEFYSGYQGTIIEALQGLDESVRTVVLAGHQPTWSYATAQLTGGGTLRFPTAALACLGHYGAWSTVAPGHCELRWLVTPKLLARGGARPLA
ncbi:MAG: histidine phosphatase family protein [Acidobacteria bacterium]|nr:histidine phosphatase family protein [Acidobacteriota bacterium]